MTTGVPTSAFAPKWTPLTFLSPIRSLSKLRVIRARDVEGTITNGTDSVEIIVSAGDRTFNQPPHTIDPSSAPLQVQAIVHLNASLA